MDGTRFIVAGSLIDGGDAEVRKAVFLTVQGAMITAIAPVADLPRHGGAPIDDFSHCTLLPALVDCSVTLAQSPSVDSAVRMAMAEAGPAKKAAMVAQHIRYCHGHGVLGVAACDDLAGLGSGCAEGVARESIIDLRLCGGLCRVHGDGGAGRDFVKVAYSATIEDDASPSPRLDQDALRCLLTRRGGKKAVVVANGRQQVAEALQAGCDAIEQGYGMGEENLRLMAERGVLWIPSVLRAKSALDGAASGGDVCCRFSQRYVAPGKPQPGAEAFWKKVLAEQLAQLGAARALGVTTALGTAAGSVGILHGESMVEEMKLFLKAGYSLAETIRCASEHGARFFGMERLGALKPGRQATFLITRGTAQQLPRKLAYLEGIYVGGLPSLAYHKHPLTSAG